MESEEPVKKTYSVQFRVRRVKTEYCYINVPVTSNLMIPQPDGTGRLNVDRMVERASEISLSSGVKWYTESEDLGPHPIQKPMEPDEERFQGPFP
ncbi:MAG: hypothetical protein QM703_26390 [Gemmatales bacterium]